jgi:hypothetical protein
MLVCDDVLTRRKARRMSREFATVGVRIAPERLQQISAGAPVVGDEHIDVNFALVVTAYNTEARATRFHDVRRHAVRWLLVGAMTLVSLSLLIGLALLMLSMVQPTFTD